MEQVKFSDETMQVVNKIIRRYPEGRQKSALLPLLHLAQAEFDGWLSVPVMDYIASILKIQPVKCMKWLRFTRCII